MTVDNVWYVLRLSPPVGNRQFGWSRGPDTPNDGGWHDWPDDGFASVPGSLWTFHWLNQNQSVAADTQEDLRANTAVPLRATEPWRHLKLRTTETTGSWYITDYARLATLLRAAAQTFGGATRTALNNWATFIETSPLVPRNGDPSS